MEMKPKTLKCWAFKGTVDLSTSALDMDTRRKPRAAAKDARAQIAL
jgi:hypothetical protein